ncbi:thiol reductant ABC exporter subunit CydC [Alicyclobacillus sp. ALC3]|uniref:thiol reductant ABC exporter subunit CydC n=1 Tax=Alicyclobacillus sp. ALC3 TaxID=2796143 RepID=UPI002379E659|nr:thiol reductant ABC exporter subunit CydC [Alicyclobacillus sp. ALC3]WDL95648.1 thiol reductant ABC exporter subunit CydC [Alicyclobacillus sp. ALC3]
MHWGVMEPLGHRRGRMLLAVMLGFMSTGASIALMATAGYLIAKAATRPSTILLLWVPIVSVRFFGISRAVFRYAERLVSHDVTFRILTDLRTRLYAVLEPRLPAMFSQWTMGKLMDTMTNDIDALQNLFLRVIAPPLVAVMTAVLSFVIIAPIGGVLLAGALLMGLTLVGVILPLLSHRISRRLRQEGVDQRSLLSQRIADMVIGMPDLVVSDDGGHTFLSELLNRQEKLNTVQLRLTRREALFESLTMITVAGTAWFLVRLAVTPARHELLTGVALCVIVLTALSSFESVLTLPNAFGALTESVSSIRRVRNIETWPVPARDPEQFAAALPVTWRMQVQHVSFSYVSAERNVLTDITFDVDPGKQIAIVGQNGAGKSTLFHLLTRLWDVQDGAILIDGMDIRQLPGDAVRNGICVVSPFAHVFHASIADNLRIAKPTASLRELQSAAEKAQLGEWIEQLPGRYETIVGETGHVPSGGQRQRIAIARAILADPHVYLLDEPLESLDTHTASQMRAVLEELTRSKTAIWITHQLRTLGSMDEILVLHDGQIIERGSHDELLRQLGRYKQMWDIEQNIVL